MKLWMQQYRLLMLTLVFVLAFFVWVGIVIGCRMAFGASMPPVMKWSLLALLLGGATQLEPLISSGDED